MSNQLKIKQVRSTIGRLEKQKRTMRALGIRRMGGTVVQEDSSVIRGMVSVVKHLVTVEVIKGA